MCNKEKTMTNSKTDTPNLLPCPWCGSDKIRSNGDPTEDREATRHFCTKCDSMGPKAAYHHDAAQRRENWNTRATLAPVDIGTLAAELSARCDEPDADLTWIVEYLNERGLINVVKAEGIEDAGHPPIDALEPTLQEPENVEDLVFFMDQEFSETHDKMVFTVYVSGDESTHIFSSPDRAKAFSENQETSCIVSDYIIDNPDRYYGVEQ